MPVFTTTASLRARRASVASATVSDPTSPLSALPANRSTDTPPTSPSAPFEGESILLKAKRAYDRDRQRAKKRKERAERERERLSITGPLPVSVSHSHSREGSGRTRGNNVKPQLAMDVDVDVVTAGAKGAGLLPLSPQVEVQDIIADVVEREAAARGEVNLAQLVKPSKARKTKAGEFELVPGMPVVIALDDALPGEAELDEPWEHISADELDEKRVAPPSYATVLAKAV